MLRVGLNRDVGDEQRVGSDHTLVALIFDSEVKSGAFAQGFNYPGEIFPTDGRRVLREGDDESFLCALGDPLPVIEPRERKALGGAVGLGEDQAAVVLVVGAAVRLGMDCRPG